jgi:Putative Flp pilus-assembly TadE/G-like
MRAPRASERGQILLVTAASLIVLMAIAAIVVDLGMSWMLRRQEQNAADPAAIAAARHIKDPITGAPIPGGAVQGPMNADACFYAQENGFFADDPGCATALASDDLLVTSPPHSGDFSARLGYVQVTIRETHPSFFGRLFGSDEAVVTTSAVASNTAGNSNSASLVALQPECQGGSAGSVNGGGEIRIFPVTPGAIGGYVHVNSPCGGSTDDICQNGSGSAALSISGTLRAPHVYTTGTCTVNGSGPGLACTGTSPCIDEDAVPLGDPLAQLPEPNFADFPSGTCPGAGPSLPSATSGCALPGPGSSCPNTGGVRVCRITPGIYYGGWDVGNRVNLELEPGMYILAGGGIRLTGNDASIEAVSNASGVAARVMIFSTDGPRCPSVANQCQGDIKVTARQAFQAKALNAATCGLVSPQACPWKGILLWQDGTVSRPATDIELGGQSSTILAGTIYAPKAHVKVSGGATGTGCGTPSTASCLSVQIISYTWTVTGGARVDMPYDPAELYQLDQRGLVD